MDGGRQETDDHAKYLRLLGQLEAASRRSRNNPVHSIPYSMYGIVATVPEHGVDKTNIIGTQLSKLITNDIPDGATFKLGGRTVTKAEAVATYDAMYTEKLRRAFEEATGRTATNEQLSRMLRDAASGSNKGSAMLEEAFELDDRGNLKVPLCDLATLELSSEFVNSVLRKAATHVVTAGGQYVQASCFGVYDQLELEFERDGDGNPTALKAVQCLMPAYSRDLAAAFMDEDGYMDPDDLPDDLREALGIRIPTAGKSFMAPLKIVGFLPPCAPTTIVLPADIVALTDSDYDVDKVPVMLPTGALRRYDLRRARRDWGEAAKKARDDERTEQRLKLAPGSLGDPVPQFKDWFKEHMDEYAGWRYADDPASLSADDLKSMPEGQLEAELLRAMRALLTSPDVAHQVVGAGGTALADRAAAMMRGLTESGGEPLGPASLEDVTVQQERNNVGKNMIAVFAVANTMHAVYQRFDGISLKEPISIGGRRYSSMTGTHDSEGTLISDTIGSLLNAAADNAKKPTLYHLNMGLATANATTLLLRLGVPLDTIAAFLNQPSIKEYAATGEVPGWCLPVIHDMRGPALELPGDFDRMTMELLSFDKADPSRVSYQAQALSLFMYLQDKAGAELRKQDALLRSDSHSESPHGPLYSNICKAVKAYNFRHQRKHLFAGWEQIASSDTDFMKSPAPIQQAIKSYAGDGSYDVMKRLFPLLGSDDFIPVMSGMLDSMYGGAVNDGNVKSLVHALYQYAGSGFESLPQGHGADYWRKSGVKDCFMTWAKDLIQSTVRDRKGAGRPRRKDVSGMDVEQITEEVQNGRLHIERFPQGVDKTYRGVLGQAEACLERGEDQTDASALEKGFRNDGAAERARQQERVGKQQEAQLEAWAKDNGLWLNDDYEDGTLETYLGQTYEETPAFGSESTIYINPYDENVIVKATNLSHYNFNPRRMLDKYVMFNALFPKTAYEIIGFGRDAMGQFTVVTQQHFVNASDDSTPSMEEIEAFMKSQGFTMKEGWWYDRTNTYRLTDLGPYNVIKDEDGDLHVIDADIELSDKSGGLSNGVSGATRATNLLDNPFVRRLSFDGQFITFNLDGQVTPQVRDAMSDAWRELLSDPDPDIRSLGTGLYIYSLYKDGARYSHGSFAQYAPVEARTSIPAYIEELRRFTDGELPPRFDYAAFRIQHIRNGLYDPKRCEAEDAYPKALTGDGGYRSSFTTPSDPRYGGYACKLASKYGCMRMHDPAMGDAFYVAVLSSDGNAWVWTKTEPLGWGAKASEYDLTKDSFFESSYDQDEARRELLKNDGPDYDDYMAEAMEFFEGADAGMQYYEDAPPTGGRGLDDSVHGGAPLDADDRYRDADGNDLCPPF